MADTLNIFGVQYSNVTGLKAKDTNNNTLTYIRPSGTYNITSDGTYNVTSYASVSVSTGGGGGITPTGTITITTNGTHNVYSYASAYVSVPTGGTINNQDISYTPDETGATLSAAAGYTGLGTVTVSPISSTYIGSGVPSGTAFAPAMTFNSATGVVTGTNAFSSGYYTSSTKTSTYTLTVKSAADLTANLSTVTVPAGYYSSQVTKNVTSATAFAPAVTLTSSTGVITGTNTFTSAYYAASTKTSTINLTTQAAQTIYTSTADQTIASYRWLTGTQTIKSVTYTGLAASQIVSGVTVKIGDANNASRITQVTGTLSFQTYYSGSTAPASSL